VKPVDIRPIFSLYFARPSKTILLPTVRATLQCPYGMTAGTSFEKALSLLLASTAVVT